MFFGENTTFSSSLKISYCRRTFENTPAATTRNMYIRITLSVTPRSRKRKQKRSPRRTTVLTKMAKRTVHHGRGEKPVSVIRGLMMASNPRVEMTRTGIAMPRKVSQTMILGGGGPSKRKRILQCWVSLVYIYTRLTQHCRILFLFDGPPPPRIIVCETFLGIAIPVRVISTLGLLAIISPRITETGFSPLPWCTVLFAIFVRTVVRRGDLFCFLFRLLGVTLSVILIYMLRVVAAGVFSNVRRQYEIFKLLENVVFSPKNTTFTCIPSGKSFVMLSS